MRECPQPPTERDWVGQAVIVAGWMYAAVLLALGLAVVVWVIVVLGSLVVDW